MSSEDIPKPSSEPKAQSVGRTAFDSRYQEEFKIFFINLAMKLENGETASREELLNLLNADFVKWQAKLSPPRYLVKHFDAMLTNLKNIFEKSNKIIDSKLEQFKTMKREIMEGKTHLTPEISRIMTDLKKLGGSQASLEEEQNEFDLELQQKIDKLSDLSRDHLKFIDRNQSKIKESQEKEENHKKLLKDKKDIEEQLEKKINKKLAIVGEKIVSIAKGIKPDILNMLNELQSLSGEITQSSDKTSLDLVANPNLTALFNEKKKIEENIKEEWCKTHFSKEIEGINELKEQVLKNEILALIAIKFPHTDKKDQSKYTLTEEEFQDYKKLNCDIFAMRAKIKSNKESLERECKEYREAKRQEFEIEDLKTQINSVKKTIADIREELRKNSVQIFQKTHEIDRLISPEYGKLKISRLNYCMAIIEVEDCLEKAKELEVKHRSKVSSSLSFSEGGGGGKSPPQSSSAFYRITPKSTPGLLTSQSGSGSDTEEETDEVENESSMLP